MTNTSSPYISLVNFCYQLRHENEELLETVSLKSSLVETCEKEIQLLKTRVHELQDKEARETNQILADRMDVSSDRYMLLQEKMRMESRLRELEVRVKVLDSQLEASREQIIIFQTQLDEANKRGTDTDEAPVPVPRSIAQLEEENARLRKQLETAAFIISESHSRAKKRRINISSPSPMPESPTTVLEMSSDQSLVRTLEQLVGYSIVKSDNVTTLVSNINENLIVRLRESNLLSKENISESAIEVWDKYGSVPGLLAKLTLEALESSGSSE